MLNLHQITVSHPCPLVLGYEGYDIDAEERRQLYNLPGSSLLRFPERTEAKRLKKGREGSARTAGKADAPLQQIASSSASHQQTAGSSAPRHAASPREGRLSTFHRAGTSGETRPSTPHRAGTSGEARSSLPRSADMSLAVETRVQLSRLVIGKDGVNPQGNPPKALGEDSSKVVGPRGEGQTPKNDEQSRKIEKKKKKEKKGKKEKKEKKHRHHKHGHKHGHEHAHKSDRHVKEKALEESPKETLQKEDDSSKRIVDPTKGRGSSKEINDTSVAKEANVTNEVSDITGGDDGSEVDARESSADDAIPRGLSFSPSSKGTVNEDSATGGSAGEDVAAVNVRKHNTSTAGVTDLRGKSYSLPPVCLLTPSVWRKRMPPFRPP